MFFSLYSKSYHLCKARFRVFNQRCIIQKETKAKVEKEAEEMFVRCAITDHERNDILNISCWSKLGNCQKVKNGCDSWSLSKEFLFFTLIFGRKKLMSYFFLSWLQSFNICGY